jgi:hypothetical protein
MEALETTVACSARREAEDDREMTRLNRLPAKSMLPRVGNKSHHDDKRRRVE